MYAGPSLLSTPLYSQLTPCTYAATNGLGGAIQPTLSPGEGNPRYAIAHDCQLAKYYCAGHWTDRSW